MIKLDDVEQGTLDKLSYLHFIAPPGRHLIAFHWNPASLMQDGSVNLELRADKTYYFDFGYEVFGRSARIASGVPAHHLPMQKLMRSAK